MGSTTPIAGPPWVGTCAGFGGRQQVFPVFPSLLLAHGLGVRLECALGARVVVGSRVWCVPEPPVGGQTPTAPLLQFLLWRLPLVPCGCCLPEDIPAPLQQLDHGCHPSVRQRCHYTWYESLTVQDVDTFWSGYGPGLRLGQHFMASPIFSCCLSLQVGREQVGQVCVCLHGTGGEAEAPDVRGLPGVTGDPGWRPVTRGLLASTSMQACAGGLAILPLWELCTPPTPPPARLLLPGSWPGGSLAGLGAWSFPGFHGLIMGLWASLFLFLGLSFLICEMWIG